MITVYFYIGVSTYSLCYYNYNSSPVLFWEDFGIHQFLRPKYYNTRIDKVTVVWVFHWGHLVSN